MKNKKCKIKNVINKINFNKMLKFYHREHNFYYVLKNLYFYLRC